MSMAGATCMAMSWCSVIRGSSEATKFDRAVQRWNIRWAIPSNDAEPLIALLRRQDETNRPQRCGSDLRRPLKEMMPVERKGKVGGFPSTGVPKV